MNIKKTIVSKEKKNEYKTIKGMSLNLNYKENHKIWEQEYEKSEKETREKKDSSFSNLFIPPFENKILTTKIESLTMSLIGLDNSYLFCWTSYSNQIDLRRYKERNDFQVKFLDKELKDVASDIYNKKIRLKMDPCFLVCWEFYNYDHKVSSKKEILEWMKIRVNNGVDKLHRVDK